MSQFLQRITNEKINTFYTFSLGKTLAVRMALNFFFKFAKKCAVEMKREGKLAGYVSYQFPPIVNSMAALRGISAFI